MYVVLPVFFIIFLIIIKWHVFVYCASLQILAGILQLGNVNFSSSSDESQPCNLDEQSKGISRDFISDISSTLISHFQLLSAVLKYVW